ncbi:branched-chain amino acid transport system II carrier protein [Candidatus Neptunochlamydia vexilliferae]|uniref:Branched-chain amino acid transport system carrier protein BrnQ n=1 Tax=Candidatus Neptunichlamydia vexilliferae TaxID=1651774 RepID=A0ABS0B1P3_9BACT|nr:branched-chain amino acid transport system II carrier protein [Candidatus Neptunochlamydia vexilliferae]MBF5059470.1 Branched-chain amino acid transport system carrier protein BrnQ [Candidatus Neptunochlamydia vexilliferae]
MKNKSLSIGLAMFSMFFGAGNITFPLVIGQTVEGGLIWALLGLILTAVLVPFSGLFSITLFEGNYESFFSRIGKWPGTIVIIILLSMIGPFGAIPRCITLTYSTLKVYFSGLHLLTFSLISCAILFLCSWKRSRIIDLIGSVLSPVLLLFLVAIIVKGVFFSSTDPVGSSQVSHPFFYGLKEGYNTMDLLAAFFFSSLVYSKLKEQAGEKKSLLLPVFKASLIGAGLLGGIYIGFSYVAAFHSLSLDGVGAEQLLGRIGQVVLGHHAGLIVCVSIALTCLTTAIALTVVCAEFLQKRISKGRISYELSLLVVLTIAALVSTLEFTGIVRLLAPILQVMYPSLLILCLFNIFHKTFDYKPVKFPVFTSLLLVLYFQYIM